MIVELEMLDDLIFTQLSDYVIEHIEGIELSDANFSTVDNDIANTTVFPFIYLHCLPGVEIGNDLEGDTLKGGLFTYEVRVTSNDSQEEVNTIMNAVTQAMKTMKFRSTSLPAFSDSGNLHIKSARWQRNFCEGDVI